MDIDTEARIVELADETKKLISENFAKPPNEIVQKRLREIREEIHGYGFVITWEVKMNIKNLTQIDAEVHIWTPKKDLSPEYQKIYDDWFQSINNITA